MSAIHDATIHTPMRSQMIMKTRTTRIAPLLFGLVQVANGLLAQAPDSSRWGSVHVAGGAFMVGDQLLFRGDLDKVAPGSALLGQDLGGHTFSDDRYYSGTGSFEMSIGLHPCMQQGRRGPELRLGFIYAGQVSQNALLRHTVQAAYDTLTSSQTGQQVFLDSVYQSDYRILRSGERFGLNASIIWRTNGRWSLFGGAGLAGGPTMNMRTRIRHQVMHWVDGPDVGYDNYPTNWRENEDNEELFRNGTGWWSSFYVPIGLDFQLARRNSFWNRLHLYYEVRPQLMVQGSPELGTYTDLGVQTLFGARLKL